MLNETIGHTTFERSDGAPPPADCGGTGNGRSGGFGAPASPAETERGAELPVPLCATVLPLAEVDRLADEIAELAAHLDAGTHRLLTLIRRLDEGSGWYTQGAMSCAQWLSWRIGLDLRAAREKVRVARALGSLPHIDEALRRGRVSYSKVRALTRVATPENEESLLEMARCSTASQLERICRGYRRALNGLLGTHPVDEAHRRWIRDSSTQDGMIRIEIQVTPEEAAVVKKAIELAMDRAWKDSPEEQGASAEPPAVAEQTSAETPQADEERTSAETCPGGERTSAETSTTSEVTVPPEHPSRPRGWWPRSIRRVDAFMSVAESYLRSASDDGRPPVEIVVHVEADALADPASEEAGTLEDGSSIGPKTVQRLACDAHLVTVVEDAAGTALDVGRRQRTIPTALRRALRYRDRGCRFPGCENRVVDGHHVKPWSQGGETKLANLCSLCRTHHRYVHELGFRVEARGDGGFAFFDRGGFEIAPVPAAPAIPRNAVVALQVVNRSAGIEIDGRTSFPRWDGTPPDYDHIVCLLANKYPPAP